jgi:hypothetical protein
MTDRKQDLAQLKWAIESRARNQKTMLKMLELFDKYESKWKSKRYSRAAQDLTSVAFSLWRAAFLADKSSKRSDVFAKGRAFLGRVVEDNAIGFPQDKQMNDWTFNYYSRAAQYSLEHLANAWKNVAPAFVRKIRAPAQRWDYCQDRLEEAVTKFAQVLAKEEARKKDSQARRAQRADRKRKRGIVRKMTLDGRQRSGAATITGKAR